MRPKKEERKARDCLATTSFPGWRQLEVQNCGQHLDGTLIIVTLYFQGVYGDHEWVREGTVVTIEFCSTLGDSAEMVHWARRRLQAENAELGYPMVRLGLVYGCHDSEAGELRCTMAEAIHQLARDSTS